MVFLFPARSTFLFPRRGSSPDIHVEVLGEWGQRLSFSPEILAPLRFCSRWLELLGRRKCGRDGQGQRWVRGRKPVCKSRQDKLDIIVEPEGASFTLFPLLLSILGAWLGGLCMESFLLIPHVDNPSRQEG